VTLLGAIVGTGAVFILPLMALGPITLIRGSIRKLRWPR
jgi:hypothetical protein